MKIIEYYVKELEGLGWEFDRVQFGGINLLVGDTATGKSRFLNTIFNIGRFVASNEFKNGGYWEILFEHGGKKYKCVIQTQNNEIVKDSVFKYEDDKIVHIVDRDKEKFIFEGNNLPKLSKKELSIYLLKEEATIKPIYEAFTIMKRRLFSQDALNSVSALATVPTNFENAVSEEKDLNKIFREELNVNVVLFYLSRYFENIYDLIIDQYKNIFHFIEDIRIVDLSKVNPHMAIPGKMPVFQIKERNSDNWISINDLSSGMQKVLLILTDIFIMPEEGVYIIDEYENSLGINAIDFFPDFVLDLKKKIQFIITSHHPYIINEIPTNNWYVFHRKGMKVSIQYGDSLVKRFSKSKQKAFIQLINDPFYLEGVE